MCDISRLRSRLMKILFKLLENKPSVRYGGVLALHLKSKGKSSFWEVSLIESALAPQDQAISRK